MKIPTGYKQTKKLEKLIKDSNTILIAGHHSPDPDCLCSALSAYRLIKSRYPKKEIYVNIEGSPLSNLSFLADYKIINNEFQYKLCSKNKPDLIIITDGNDINRITSRENKLNEYLMKYSPHIAVIDHHNESPLQEVDVFINNQLSSATEEVYKIFIKKLNYEIEIKTAEIILLGILEDTSRFFWKNPNFRDTVNNAADLIELGLHIEDLTVKSTPRINKYQLDFMAELSDNVVITDKYNYTFISDQLIESLSSKNLPYGDFKYIYRKWMDEYLKLIGDNKWGFVIFKEFGKRNIYKGSFRAIAGTIDVSVFGRALSGGGHKPAAGFGDIKASDVHEAINKVKVVIEEKYEEAIKLA